MNRITNSMMTSRYLNNMQKNLRNMSTIQNQLATGKQISRPSQNPFIATRNKQLDNEIAENKQYNVNINDTSNWLDTTDTALAQAGNVLARIKELMIKVGDGGYGEDEIATIKDEVVEKTKELGQILNTTFEGAYIFGGTQALAKPVTVDENGNMFYSDKNGGVFGNSMVSPSAPLTSSTGDDLIHAQTQLKSSLITEISQGVNVEYNKTVTNILEYDDSNLGHINVMEELSTLIKNLGDLSDSDHSNNDAALAYMNGNGLTRMDSIIKNLLANRAQVGTMENRMKSALETNEDQSYNMTEILSSTEDIDFTEKTMEYAVMQTVYTASLQTSSKVLMNTIMDYI